jgi:hypothetical protein
MEKTTKLLQILETTAKKRLETPILKVSNGYIFCDINGWKLCNYADEGQTRTTNIEAILKAINNNTATIKKHYKYIYNKRSKGTTLRSKEIVNMCNKILSLI